VSEETNEGSNQSRFKADSTHLCTSSTAPPLRSKDTCSSGRTIPRELWMPLQVSCTSSRPRPSRRFCFGFSNLVLVLISSSFPFLCRMGRRATPPHPRAEEPRIRGVGSQEEDPSKGQRKFAFILLISRRVELMLITQTTYPPPYFLPRPATLQEGSQEAREGSREGIVRIGSRGRDEEEGRR